jgi:hypothetical protein
VTFAAAARCAGLALDMAGFLESGAAGRPPGSANLRDYRNIVK